MNGQFEPEYYQAIGLVIEEAARVEMALGLLTAFLHHGEVDQWRVYVGGAGAPRMNAKLAADAHFPDRQSVAHRAVAAAEVALGKRNEVVHSPQVMVFDPGGPPEGPWTESRPDTGGGPTGWRIKPRSGALVPIATVEYLIALRQELFEGRMALQGAMHDPPRPMTTG